VALLETIDNIYKWLVNLVLNIFAVRVNSKLHFLHAAVGKINSQTVTTK